MAQSREMNMWMKLVGQDIKFFLCAWSYTPKLHPYMSLLGHDIPAASLYTGYES
jgi:hypothetical protein